MLNKKVAMLDEPDSGLDVDGIKTLIQHLKIGTTKTTH